MALLISLYLQVKVGYQIEASFVSVFLICHFSIYRYVHDNEDIPYKLLLLNKVYQFWHRLWKLHCNYMNDISLLI